MHCLSDNVQPDCLLCKPAQGHRHSMRRQDAATVRESGNVSVFANRHMHSMRRQGFAAEKSGPFRDRCKVSMYHTVFDRYGSVILAGSIIF